MFAIYHEEGLTAKFLEKKANWVILRPINPNAEIQIIDLNENPQPIVGKLLEPGRIYNVHSHIQNSLGR
jgi:SOS-response transcriptional repressor LexA